MAKKAKDQVVEETVVDEQAAAEAERLAQETAAKIEVLKGQEADLEAQLKEIKNQLRELSPSAASRRGPVGVGAFIKEQITAGKTNAEIMELVADQFPANNTNVNCINWYRNALKQWPDGKRPGKKAQAVEQSVEQEADESVEDAEAQDEAFSA